MVIAGDLSPEGILEVLGEHLHVEPARGEDNGLDLVSDEIACHLSRRGQGRLADAELAVDDGRVVKDEGLGRPRRPALIDELHLTLQEVLCVLLGVGNRSGTADKYRVGAIEAADPLQTPEHIGEVATEHPSVDVQLVHHHVSQVGKELLPLGVVGQDAGVEHVGVGDHYVALLADGLTRVIRRVSVIGEGFDVGLELADEAMHLVHLVLGQGLGGKEIDCPGLGFFQDLLEHRDVVAQSLAARRWCHEDHVPAVTYKVDGMGLMAVELGNAALGEY